MKPRITAKQFEHGYAERSGITVEELRRYGRVVRPCDCDYEECEGWQSTTVEADEADQHMRRVSS